MRLAKRNGSQKRGQNKFPGMARAVRANEAHPAVAKLAVALREYKELAEQHAATAEILRALSGTEGDPQPVFETIVEKAHRLTGAALSILYRYDGKRLSVVTERHVSAAGIRALQRLYPAAPRRDHFVGRAVLDRRPVHSADVRSDARFPGTKNVFAKAVPYRAALAVPLLKDGKVLGAVATERLEPKPFSKREIALLRTFADQAVIAIENVRLLNDTMQALEHQKTSADILKIVASSVADTGPVFTAITEAGSRLVPGCRFSLQLVRDGHLHFASHSGVEGVPRAQMARFFPIPIKGGPTPAAKAIDEKRVVHVADIEQAGKQLALGKQIAKAAGWRAIVAVPLMRGGDAMGSITITRPEPGPFDEKQIALLQTFAGQAVIALENAKMFREIQQRNAELKQSLEFQSASGEILSSISSSIADAQPVFDAIVTSLLRLFGTRFATVALLRDGELHLAALRGDKGYEWLKTTYPQPPKDWNMTGRAVLSGKVQQLAPCIGNPGAPPRTAEVAAKVGFNSIIAAPMIREGKVVGAITTGRRDAVPFDDKQVALIKAFADQAVIAIENARLFNETKNSLARQTATAEILRVLGSSMTDVQPVFDAIVKNCSALFGEGAVVLRLVSEGRLVVQASVDYASGPMPLDRSSAMGACVLEGRTLHFPDLDEAAKEYPRIRQLGLKYGYRSGVYAPLMRAGKAIGGISVLRRKAGAFDEKEVQLLTTFADQAVIAIENVRLFNETKEALERQTATANILGVIAQSPTDIQPVLDTIAERAATLCEASVGAVVRYDGALIHLAALKNVDPRVGEAMARAFPMAPGRGAGVARAVLTKQSVHIPDVLVEPDYAIKDASSATGFRSVFAVPMLRGEAVIGAIAVGRPQPGPFDERHMALLRTFADQAVIAIENVRLFNQTREALERQTATAEILKVIAGSPTEVQPVFDAIAQAANRLVGGFSVAVLRIVEGHLHLAALTSTSNAGDEMLRHFFPRPLSAFGKGIGSAVRSGVPQATEDFQNDPEVPAETREVARARGFRGSLAVPMLRGDEVLGVINVTRREAGRFSEHQVELLKTFADQAVIAIENVRLFNETKEALERQTATAEILKVIASSPSDVQPVFDTIVASSKRLLAGRTATFARVVDDQLHLTAFTSTSPEADEELRRFYPRPLTAGYAISRAARELRPILVSDTETDPNVSPETRELARRRGYRSALTVPMLRGEEMIGVLAVTRELPGPFSPKELALLQTFADQAVIAIENVRLFNETKEALERQTASSEILKVISSSPTDVQPVFDAIVDAAQRLIGGKRAGLLLRRETDCEVVASSEKGVIEQLPDEVRIVPLDRSKNFPSRAILDGEVVHVPDWEADEVPEFEKLVARTYGIKSGVIVPLLRQGQGIGALGVTRAARGAYHEKQIALLRSFADQAVIAIENTRLFNETKESLEQQTAIARILGVMSSSPTDVQPVLDAVAESAARLCETDDAVIRRVEPGGLRRVAHFGPLPVSAEGELHPIVPGTVGGRAVLECRAIYIADTEEEFRDESYSEARALWMSADKYRTMLAMPLVREGAAIGVIVCRRREKRPFSYRQITLLKTFADQAVIAIENVRLFNETKDALERQTASAEILRVIAAARSDTRPVFDAILRSGMRLFSGMSIAICLMQRDELRIVAADGEFGAMPIGYLVPQTRDSTSGTAVSERRTVTIPDTEAPDVSQHTRDNGRRVGFRAVTSVPMLREGEAIGCITVMQKEAGGLTARQLDLLRSFADQAVIAIENVRLFNETKAALERQTATSEILRVISSSPSDVQPVFNTIAKNFVALCGGVFGAVFRYEDGLVHYAGSAGFTPEQIERVRTKYPVPVDDPSVISARTIAARAPVHIDDALADPHYDRDHAATAGWRRMLAVPMLREGEPLGSIVAAWAEPGTTPAQHEELLKLFADQAVIAIENVRLFNETKEALEQQTATSEVLNVLSRSTLDVTPVFQAVVDKAVALCGADNASILQRDGDAYRYVANAGRFADQDSFMSYWGTITLRPGRGSLTGRVALERRSVQIEDIDTDPEYERDYAAHKVSGSKAHLGVPLLKDGEPVGLIIARRFDARLFADKQIRLLETFAAQAVIAIENVRLFKELQERTQALTKSVGQLTALGQVGQAITSTLDLETVLKTIVTHAVQLTGVDSGAIYEYDEAAQLFRLQAAEKFEPELLDAVRNSPIRKGDGATGRIAVTLEAEQVPDIEEDSYRGTRKNVLVRAGYRAVLAVPLLRENHLLGALQVFRRAPGAFAPEVVELLKTFATQSALAIQNARLFREIAQKGKQLEVASEHKSQFLASMSHELRTPLNALLGFNEMLLGDVYGEVPADMKPPLAQMQSSGRHLLRLINNVLDLAKIEAGRMELALSEYSVQDTVESVRSTLHPLATDKGLEFRTRVQPEIPLAYGDPGRITQCLMNLAGNSLKFTKAGKVEISVALDNGRLRYSVADTGIGIPPDKMQSLFTEFKQTDATIASEYGGTGLGLSISKKFVEMHGGRVWAESEPGKGSTFIFEIPLRAQSAKSA